ncbi:class A beta-lactamase-related serine hydrolase [Maribacter algicola]|uniref:Class A beta-lactamase-related serine hydrolase n=1 Tax=Maribacter algicola TaxID=2498892 RepID=A0A3R8RZ92_9FLAO|nr:serine hydrolase domain-containing protein [Maribacter algicola]RRQ48652.1 class A beta-lactamase-related serine hydrolase [Maribacter algicola]
MKNLVLVGCLILLVSCSKTSETKDTPTTQTENPGSTTDTVPEEPEGEPVTEEETVAEEPISFENFEAQITSFMETYQVPGLQVAITKDEQLVYAQSFGFSDVENQIPVADNSLFRIASISKPITFISMLKLSEDGQVSLGGKVFGESGILGTEYGALPYSPGVLDISVNDLIEHRSGWTNDPYDIMFDDPSLSYQELFSEMIDNRRIDETPTYYYLNFGYAVLGRVVEKVSNVSYEAYVQENVLAPMGITEMKIGGNTLDERLENEVVYYPSTEGAFSPYDMNVTRMDAHGGWIASATDLARFIVHIDRRPNVQDILPTNRLNRPYFNFFNWVHTGSLPGTSSIMSRHNDTFNYTVLMNKRSTNYEAILNAVQSVINNEIDTRTKWPNVDLFEEE